MQPTSIEAGQSISPEEISRVQKAILDLLRIDGPMTDEQIALTFPNLFVNVSHPPSQSSLRTRRSELVTMGLVRESGQTRPSAAGRRMIVWELVPVQGGMRPNAMPGRPDRYVNIDRAKEQAADAERRQAAEDLERANAAKMEELRKVPYLERPPRVDFGQLPCPFCKATGGNKADGACKACAGTGIAR